MERVLSGGYCDNEAVVVILNSRHSKDLHLMHMLRTLFFIEAQYQFKLIARHVLGKLNTLADYLSRNKLKKIFTNHHIANQYLSCVPDNLL